MRLSVWPSSARPWHEVAAIADHAESTGWDGIYVYDHLMPNTPDGAVSDGPVLEGWTMLTAIAARTSRMRVGSLVLSATFRHPSVLASMAATLDHIADGRLILGVGAGWQVNEHRAYGIEFLPTRELLDRFDEYCAALTSLLGERRTTMRGTYVTLDDAPREPKPAQAHLPLLIGGRGERRTMRIAATYADEWNAWTTPETFRHKREVLAAHCESLGRDPGSIRCSTQARVTITDHPTDEPCLMDGRLPVIAGTAEQVAEVLQDYAQSGVDEFIVPDREGDSLGEALELLDRLRTEVIPL